MRLFFPCQRVCVFVLFFSNGWKTLFSPGELRESISSPELRALTFPESLDCGGVVSSPFGFSLTTPLIAVNENLIDGRMDALPVYAVTRLLFSLLP